MRDVLPDCCGWWRDGETVGVGTVVATLRSAPRPPGASMLVGPDGEAVGSVSGGCVEGAVYELAQQVVAAGGPVLQRYGVSDDDAFAVGLTCGGILDVFVETVSTGDASPSSATVAADDRGRRAGRGGHRRRAPGPDAGRAAGWSSGPEDGRRRPGSSARTGLDDAVADDARGLLAAGRTETLHYGPDGERRGEGMRVFVAVVRAARRGCWSSARSTSRPRWPGSARSSATT